MRIKEIEKIPNKLLQCDIETETGNFFIYPKGKKGILIHNSPAIFFGKDPETGDNILALKALFGIRPKIIRSIDNIKELYEAKPDLVKKLEFVWNTLNSIPNLTNGEIWQGDLMFTPDSIAEKDIEGESYFVFHPNTILYAVKEDSEAGKIIGQADVGVVWHTRYKGPNISELKSSHDIDESDLKKNPKLWQISPNFQLQTGGKVSSKDFENKLSRASILLNKLENLDDEFNSLKENKNLIIEINTFINNNIRSGNLKFDPKTFVSQFKQATEDKYKERLEKFTAAGKRPGEIKAVQRALDNILSSIDKTFIKVIPLVIALQQTLNDMKLEIINIINDKVSGDIKTYLLNKDGRLVPTKHEGFVLVDPKTGKTGKAVDRLNFSKANFSDEWVKGWEHPLDQ